MRSSVCGTTACSECNRWTWEVALSKRLAFLCILQFILSTSTFAQDAPITDCDKYAASDVDPKRQTTGIPFHDLDPALAVPACEDAVRQYPNNARLIFELGRAYNKAHNLTAALQEYGKAAVQGYAAAQNNLGNMYKVGQGVPKDDWLAIAWYRKAANQGVAAAQKHLDELESSLR